MLGRIAAVLVLLSVTMSTRARAQTQDAVAQLSWVAGCWQQRTPERHRVIEEQWMVPRARTMFGMSRTVRGDSVAEFEHLKIVERNGHAVYHAEPSGQRPAEFEARVVSDTLVVFENPTHDFPQRVSYRRRGADSLIARIEGTRAGQTRGVDFPYARVACP
jgi:hypothetical protein